MKNQSPMNRPKKTSARTPKWDARIKADPKLRGAMKGK